MQQVDASVAVKGVHATRGKWLCAEPVAVIYQQSKVKHVDPPLATLVWAVTELAERGAWAGPRIRGLWDPPLAPRWGS